ncbi:MAG TPA: PIG-L family deacetylase [Acidimicrobiales bacterium]|nr:PIG-L family deacetylase [Acidimicrobiales bacterium]
MGAGTGQGDQGQADEASWGLVDPAVLERIAVVSPHFDDAVLGAAHLIDAHPGCTVVTVLGGRPPRYPEEPTDWDACGGFVAGDDVVALRRQEDFAALAVLGATPVWLEFSDHQYLAPEERPRPEEVAPALTAALAAVGPSAVFLPMGLANPDHGLTHEAGLLARTALLEDGAATAWFCYEDHGYKHIPGILAWRVSKLFRSGLWPTPAVVPITPDMARKRAAIACYTSQLPPLQRDHALDERLDANVPEQFWRLAPPPRGWERLMEV